MSSWVLLLWALAACVRFVCAEGDPLPPALVELVRSSAISSIQDLQLLLEPDSVDEDPDSQTSERRHVNGTSMRFPRSLAAEQAQQALCKVRTEVLEVTRDMLDRRNANFMLWPPCVEVQRCSGCCYSRSVQCVPIVTRTRYLQVMKIQYINKNPHYEKAVISVQDHVECRCQSSAPPSAPRTTSRNPQHAVQPQRLAPKAPPLKTPSKEELHRQDELKQNQNVGPSDRDPQRPLWPANRVPAHTHTHASRAPITEGAAQTGRTHGGEGKEPQPTQEALRAQEGDRKPAHGSGDGGVQRPRPQGPSHNVTAHHTAPHRPAEEEGEGRTHTHDTHRTQAGSAPQQGSVSHNRDHDHNHSPEHNHNHSPEHNHNHSHEHNHNHNPDHNQNHNHSHEHNHNHNPQHNHNHGHEHNHSHSHDHKHEHKPNQTETAEHKDTELSEKEEERLLQLDLQKEQELLLLQRKLEQEREQLKQHEELQRHHQQQEQHHLHHRVQVHTTTQSPVTTARPPPPAQKPARRPVRRRLRKHRRRISKAAMRAMLI